MILRSRIGLIYAPRYLNIPNVSREALTNAYAKIHRQLPALTIVRSIFIEAGVNV